MHIDVRVHAGLQRRGPRPTDDGSKDVGVKRRWKPAGRCNTLQSRWSWLTAPKGDDMFRRNHENGTEGFARGGDPDSCGDLRPTQAGKSDDGNGHHQG